MRISRKALTFDDVLLEPAYSDVLPRQVGLQTRLTRTIGINIPIVSSAMDTVTEGRLAIALAQEGGMGIVHKNMTPERQAAQVRMVKKFESGVINAPINVPPQTTIGEVIELTREHGISGVPVVEGDQLVGIVTSRDLRFVNRHGDVISSIMTPREKLVTVKEGAGRDEILDLLHRHRIEKLLVVNDDFALRGMITVKDIQKSTDFPHAAKDQYGQLRVGAALGTGSDTDARLEALTEAGVDVVVVDTAHGHSRGVLDRIRDIKQEYPELQVIGGNVATSEGALALVEAGVDAVKVGIGPGSICTTRIVAGVGVPQITAVSDVAEALKGTDVPLISDGGIRFSGDISKTIAAGAWSAMLGGLFAGTEESPGEVELYQGRTFKSYRGMGSLGAMSGEQGSSDRYFQDTTQEVENLVPEGIEGRVPYKGPLAAIIHQLMGGLRASMGYTGSHDIEEMRTRARFVQITSAGVRESHVHDVNIVKEAPNYRVDN